MNIFNMMLRSKIMSSLLFLSVVTLNDALRILIVIPMVSKSHSILGDAMAKRLVEAGHEVVFMTPYPQNESVSNIKEVSLAALHENIRKEIDKRDEFKLKHLVNTGKRVESNMVHYLSKMIHESLFKIDEVYKMLSDPNEKFDVVIAEWFFYDAIASLSALFECPLIWFSTTEPAWNVLQLVDEVPNPAYSVDTLSMNRPPLSFWQRATEFWNIFTKKIFLSFAITPSEITFYETFIKDLSVKRGVNLPAYEDVIYNASMFFIGSHPSYGVPYRLPQNAKYIGGFHVDESPKPLLKDLQKIMDSAKDGVIYFSMGSNLKSSDMSEEMRDSLFKMFSKFKQTVLWKIETDFKEIPPNVHLIKWAPQQSILSHPNLKMFITQGGQLSTTEAIHHGVPVIGIPIMADQHINMRSVEDKGFGIVVQIDNDVSNKLETAINKILKNSSYKEKAREISMIYHDRPVPPAKELVHWVEHVIKTRGAPHLRSPALMVPWYQKMYLDLLLVVVFTILAVSVLIKNIFRKYCQRMPKKIKKNE